jgi:hypothetical protein
MHGGEMKPLIDLQLTPADAFALLRLVHTANHSSLTDAHDKMHGTWIARRLEKIINARRATVQLRSNASLADGVPTYLGS